MVQVQQSTNLRSLLTKGLWVVLLAVLLLGVPMVSGRVASIFDYQVIDPDGVYAWRTVRHVVFGAVFLLLIGVIRQYTSLEFGLCWGDTERGKKYVGLFALGFTIYTVIAYSITFLTDSFEPIAYPLTATNITGHMGFQLLLPGPVEELVFRAFAITLLSALLAARVFNGKLSVANIIAAVIFGVAHAEFFFTPFAVAYDSGQVAYAIGLGLIYGDCYEKTGSVIYPIIMHTLTNVLMVGIQIAATFYLG